MFSELQSIMCDAVDCGILRGISSVSYTEGIKV